MQDSRYRVVLCESDTGVVLNDDGSRYLRGTTPSDEHWFDSLEDALAFKDQLLGRFPSKRFEVTVIGGPAGFNGLALVTEPESPEREVDGVYVAHWEVPRFVVPAGRRLFGLLPRVEKWLPRFPETLPALLADCIRDRSGVRYFRLRVRGRLGPPGQFGHMGTCSHELFVAEILACEETTEPGLTWCEQPGS